MRDAMPKTHQLESILIIYNACRLSSYSYQLKANEVDETYVNLRKVCTTIAY